MLELDIFLQIALCNRGLQIIQFQKIFILTSNNKDTNNIIISLSLARSQSIFLTCLCWKVNQLKFLMWSYICIVHFISVFDNMCHQHHSFNCKLITTTYTFEMDNNFRFIMFLSRSFGKTIPPPG